MNDINPHLHRAEILLGQGRYDLAETQLRQAIATDPNEFLAYSYLAICLAEVEKFEEASEAADRGVSLMPDAAFTHYVRARVLADRHRLREAREAIEEALRLDPDDAASWATRAQIDIGEKKYNDALEATDRGLECDADYEGCINLRALALTQLGRRDEAGETIGSTLSRNPLNPASHANLGWTLLHQGKPREAMAHFREALRLDPGMEWARSGVVEAMKARSIIYRLFLAYFLFMSRLNSKAQWGVLIGGYVAYQILRSVRTANPQLAVYLTPLIVAYFVFALGTIVAVPLFNLFLFLNPFGRLVLGQRQKVCAAVFGVTMLPAVTFLVLWAIYGGNAYGYASLLTGLLLIPVALAGEAATARARRVMTSIAALLAAACAVMVALGFMNMVIKNSVLIYALACFGSTWISNALSTAGPEKR